MWSFKCCILFAVFLCQVMLSPSTANATEVGAKSRFLPPPRIKTSADAAVREDAEDGNNRRENTSENFHGLQPHVSQNVEKDEQFQREPDQIIISRSENGVGTNSDGKTPHSFHPESNSEVPRYTRSYGTTPGFVMYKPSPSYYRPSTRPTEPTFTTTTFRPIVTTTSGITFTSTAPTVTTFRPMMTTSTSRPVTVTMGPTVSTTSRPITPVPTSPPSTLVPVIGGGDNGDDEEEELDVPVPVSQEFNTEGSMGRSLFTRGKRPRNTTRVQSTTRAPITIERKIGTKLATRSRPGARSMKLEGDPNVVTDFVFSDIKCYRSKSREYFGASIHMKDGYHVPYIRDRPQDPLTSSDCKMERLDTPDTRYRMAATDLRACGVEQCGDSMCLTMVFPKLPTLALADDEVTTIRCVPQQSSVSETQSISFSGDSLDKRRSSSTVEGGGQDFAAEVGIFRQNPGTSNGLFAKRVNSGGVVQLGEPLQLRSVVRGGDGWSHSKLLDVKVWRMREGYAQTSDKLNTNDASEVITLVDTNGCRNPEYEVIADSHPLRDPRNNLVHHFTFRAFLFRGQRANEPLIVTAKVQACQDAGECRPSDCISESSDPNVKRYKRAVEHHNASSIVHDYDTQLALHVVGLRDNLDSIPEKYFSTPAPGSIAPTSSESFSCAEKMAISAVGGGCIMLFLCGLGSSLLFYSISNRRAAAARKSEGTPESRSGVSPTAQPSINTVHKRDKPLPPTPMDYDPAPIAAEISPCNDRGLKLDKSKRPYEHRSTGGIQSGCVYECITETREKQQNKSQDDGVFVVYCCNKCNKDTTKHGSSASAPSSLRGKKRSTRKKLGRYEVPDADDTEESEESYASEKPRPRTVRGVKRNNQKHQPSGIRRRLSSLYREVYGNRHSFPARISAKNVYGSTRRGKVCYGDRNDIYAEGLSQSSDMDSAYCESVCSKHVEDGNCNRNCGGVRRKSEHDIYRPVSKPDTDVHSDHPFKYVSAPHGVGYPNLPVLLDGTVRSNGIAPPGLPPKAQHSVARNEPTTQIIVLPETNV